MKLTFDRSFAKILEKQIENFDMRVGVLDDKPHKFPLVPLNGQQENLGSYAGGPVRRTSREASELSISDVLIANMRRLNINILLRPFEEPDSEILKFTTAFLKMACDKGANMKRIENLLQAIVRNPILRQNYGQNSSTTADSKGFDRHLIDTGQMFKAIKARVKRG